MRAINRPALELTMIIAYSHCIAHGINMTNGMQNQKAAVNSGQWLLYRFDPRRAERGENPLQLDSGAPKTKVQDYLLSENRFKMLTKSRPTEAKHLFAQAQADADKRYKFYQFLQTRDLKSAIAEAVAQKPPQTTVDQQP